MNRQHHKAVITVLLQAGKKELAATYARDHRKALNVRGAPLSPLDKAYMEYTNALNEYKVWAREEGLLTKEERAEKEKAWQATQTAWRKLAQLREKIEKQ